MSVKKLYNADAYAKNTLVVHSAESGCCGSDSALALYEHKDDFSGVPFSGITVKVGGVNKTAEFDPVTDDAKGVRVALAKALKALGFDPYFDDHYKGITVSIGEGNDRVNIIGDAEIVSLTIDGSEEPVAKYATPVGVCIFSFTYNDTEEVSLSLGSNSSSFTTEGVSAGITALTTLLTSFGLPPMMITGSIAADDTVTLKAHVEGSSAIGIKALDGITTIMQEGCYPAFK